MSSSDDRKLNYCRSVPGNCSYAFIMVRAYSSLGVWLLTKHCAYWVSRRVGKTQPYPFITHVLASLPGGQTRRLMNMVAR